ncbi:hypothetical protein [Brevibacillus dissolubilis]|uniref:hypothetical protein n=1 Tax=Brevibacillus dissolubilis TaxID=1844116 RepID=UPI001115CA28|nr:hypothetical protein [Brevibacillus dissolubilis]
MITLTQLQQLANQIEQLKDMLDLVQQNVQFNVTTVWTVLAFVVTAAGAALLILAKQWVHTKVEEEMIQINLAQYARKQQHNWLTPTLLNGWQNSNSDTPVGFLRDEFGFVRLKGCIMNGLMKDGTTIFRLPEGYRPEETQRFGVTCGSKGNLQVGVVEVQESGDIKIFGCYQSDVILNGVVFQIKSG